MHEPGNAFSYPGSLDQLKADQPQQTTSKGRQSRLQLLSSASNSWGSQSKETVSSAWSEGGGKDVTSGSLSNHSFKTSATVAGGLNIEGLGLKAKVSFGYNSSSSVSTVNSSIATFAESTGVLVNRGIDPGGPTSTSDYLYEGQSYIFGQLAPMGTIQDDITQKTTVKAQGILTLAYVADILSTGLVQSGNWWKQAYTIAPDVALNHPQRWL